MLCQVNFVSHAYGVRKGRRCLSSAIRAIYDSHVSLHARMPLLSEPDSV